MVVTCALMDIRTSRATDRSRRLHTLQFTFMSPDPNSLVLWKNLGSGAHSSVRLRSILVIDGWTLFWSETMTLFSGLGAFLWR